jgi:UDP-3-O-[3-hydroxymyristoyl] glucosamine N-acyltransferase
MQRASVLALRALCSSVSPSASLAPGVIVMEGATIGARSVIDAHAVIGRDVVVGEAVRVGAGVSLSNCTVGDSTNIHPGVCIGQDGFGFILDDKCGGHRKKPQKLRVVIGRDCDIGANSCIDRGSWRNTQIGDGCKLDNLVQIGHNAQLGAHCVVAALCGIGGSATLGNRVFIGAQTGILQHVTIGDGAKVAARSGVTDNVSAGQTVGGSPAVPIRDHHKQTVALRLMSKQRKRTVAR